MSAQLEQNPADARTADGLASAPASPRTTPGALLKLARERAGLTIEDLAAQIKLAKATLEALEQDNFSALSEPVYVRGYYRKIAKVLPVPEKELIEAYAQCKPAAAAPPVQRIPQLAGGVDAGVSRRGQSQGLLLTIGIVGVTVGLLFFFADKNKPARLADTEPKGESLTDVSPAPAPTSAPAAVELKPAPAESATASEKSEAQPEPARSHSDFGSAAAVSSGAAAAATPNQLILDFTESSFVRVEDSRNRTLAIGLARGGERQTLDGQPPYTVFLGNARNVKVFHKGQPVDFSASINAENDTARFTVP